MNSIKTFLIKQYIFLFRYNFIDDTLNIFLW